MNIFDGFQVIGVRAPGPVPFCGFDCAFGIVHYLLWSSSRTGILTDRLLGKDWCEFCAFDRRNITRCGELESVTKAERWRKSERSKHILISGFQISVIAKLPAGLTTT